MAISCTGIWLLQIIYANRLCRLYPLINALTLSTMYKNVLGSVDAIVSLTVIGSNLRH